MKDKYDIVKAIIKYVNRNQDISSDKQAGIIHTVEDGYKLEYYIALRQLCKVPIALNENISLLADIRINESGSLYLHKSASELELLMVLQEINKKIADKVCI